MAADDDDVVVLRATGETLPNGPLDEGGNGVVYLLATPAQAASGESLLSFLENPEKGYVLKEIKGKRYAWKPLTPDLQVVPRVADDIHVFLIKAPAPALAPGYADISEVPLRDDDFTVKDGFMKLPRIAGDPDEVYVRVSYKRAFHKIFNNNYKFTHLSGNPGIGKSCCLWYFVSRLRQLGCSIVVQLSTFSEFYYFHGGKCEQATQRAAIKYLGVPGTWLLIDQSFNGVRNKLGRAVLFASPNPGNGAVDAEKTMDEGYFTILHMCAWKPAELLALWNRKWQDNLQRTEYSLTGKERDFFNPPGYTSAANFMARLYICGGIVRHFRRNLSRVVQITGGAVEYYVKTLREPANSGVSHRIFLEDPEHNMEGIREVKFVSPWCKKRFGQEFYRANLEKRLELLDRTKVDSKFVTAAAGVFEDFAHKTLSDGGEFLLSDGSRITLPPADIKFHYGNSLTFTDSDRDKYVLPLSRTFPLVDSIAGRFQYLLQVTRAKERRPMWKSDYEELVKVCESIGQQKPIFVLVIPEGHCELPYTKLKTPKTDVHTKLKTPKTDVHTKPKTDAHTKLKTPKTDADGQRKRKRFSYSITELKETKQLILPRPEKAKLVPDYRLELQQVMEEMERVAREKGPLFEFEDEECEECGLWEGDDWIVCGECKSWYHRVCAKWTFEDMRSQFFCKLCKNV